MYEMYQGFVLCVACASSLELPTLRASPASSCLVPIGASLCFSIPYSVLSSIDKWSFLLMKTRKKATRLRPSPKYRVALRLVMYPLVTSSWMSEGTLSKMRLAEVAHTASDKAPESRNSARNEDKDSSRLSRRTGESTNKYSNPQYRLMRISNCVFQNVKVTSDSGRGEDFSFAL